MQLLTNAVKNLIGHIKRAMTHQANIVIVVLQQIQFVESVEDPVSERDISHRHTLEVLQILSEHYSTSKNITA